VTGSRSAQRSSGSAPKAGSIPLHAWLPDAHSQAPAPYRLIPASSCGRVLRRAAGQSHRRPRAGHRLPRTLLLILAFPPSPWPRCADRQRDYKRMLAILDGTHGPDRPGAAIGTSWPSPRCCCTWPDTALAKTVAFLPPDISCTTTPAPRSPTYAPRHRIPLLGRTVRPRHRGPARLPPAALFRQRNSIAPRRHTYRPGWSPRRVHPRVLAFAAITGPHRPDAARTPTTSHTQDSQSPARAIHPTPSPGAALPLIAGLLGSRPGHHPGPSPTSCTPPPPSVGTP